MGRALPMACATHSRKPIVLPQNVMEKKIT
jgi:hypothetical protein